MADVPTLSGSSLASRSDSSRARRADRLFAACVWAAALFIVTAFLWLVGDIVYHGWRAVDWTFLTSDPIRAGRDGGIAPIILSTLAILGICLVASIPLGIATALYLSEFAREKAGFGRLVRACLDVLAGVPSIVFGLFGNAFFCVYLGMGFSILSGGLTLACMVLPIFIRSVELGLRAVPDDYRHAGAALAIGRGKLIRKVVLPAAAPAIGAGLMLGIGRAMAETAALIFTSGYVDRAPRSLFDSGRALSIHIYDLAMNVPGGEGNAYGSAFVLVVLLIAINASALWLVHRVVARNIHTA